MAIWQTARHSDWTGSLRVVRHDLYIYMRMVRESRVLFLANWTDGEWGRRLSHVEVAKCDRSLLTPLLRAAGSTGDQVPGRASSRCEESEKQGLGRRARAAMAMAMAMAMAIEDGEVWLWCWFLVSLLTG